MTHDSVATAENSRATTQNLVATTYDLRPTTPESHSPVRNLPETSPDLREIPANSVETIHVPVAEFVGVPPALADLVRTLRPPFHHAVAWVDRL
jgi:hypothetical protein